MRGGGASRSFAVDAVQRRQQQDDHSRHHRPGWPTRRHRRCTSRHRSEAASATRCQLHRACRTECALRSRQRPRRDSAFSMSRRTRQSAQLPTSSPRGGLHGHLRTFTVMPDSLGTIKLCSRCRRRRQLSGFEIIAVLIVPQRPRERDAIAPSLLWLAAHQSLRSRKACVLQDDADHWAIDVASLLDQRIGAVDGWLRSGDRAP